jgi:putative transposase
MLNMTWEFKREPTAEQGSEIEDILDVCRNVWNFALRERKDWLNSRKSTMNACSLWGEYILPADEPFPNYQRQAQRLTAAKQVFEELKTVNAQVLQQVLRKLEVAWELWRLKRAGLPRLSGWGPFAMANCLVLWALICLRPELEQRCHNRKSAVKRH